MLLIPSLFWQRCRQNTSEMKVRLCPTTDLHQNQACFSLGRCAGLPWPKITNQSLKTTDIHPPSSWRPDVWCQGVPQLCSLRRLQGRVLPASSSFWGLQASLGLGPPPSRLCLCLPGASPLCLCLSSSVSYKDPVIGCRATLLQEDLISDPSLHYICRDPASTTGPFPRFQASEPNTLEDHCAGCHSPPISWGSCLGHV